MLKSEPGNFCKFIYINGAVNSIPIPIVGNIRPVRRLLWLILSSLWLHYVIAHIPPQIPIIKSSISLVPRPCFIKVTGGEKQGPSAHALVCPRIPGGNRNYLFKNHSVYSSVFAMAYSACLISLVKTR